MVSWGFFCVFSPSFLHPLPVNNSLVNENVSESMQQLEQVYSGVLFISSTMIENDECGKGNEVGLSRQCVASYMSLVLETGFFFFWPITLHGMSVGGGIEFILTSFHLIIDLHWTGLPS